MPGIKKHSFFLAAAACLTAGVVPLAANTPMAGGAFGVEALASVSGGEAATGATLVLSAANMGGPVFSASALIGGIFSLETGAAPAVIPYAAARTDLGAAHCYPVPFKPSAGHTKITFTGLTRAARIRVYTVGGQLVRTLDKSDAGDTLDWDVKNSRGENLASGVYLFIVKSASQTATGKLMVIR